MTPDAQSHEFVTAVRPHLARRTPLLACAGFVVAFAVIFAIVAAQGPVLGALIMFVFFAGVIVLVGWLLTRGLARSTFVIDAQGMTVRTPRGSRTLPWSDVAAVTVSARDNAHLLLASLRPGVTAPTPTPLGLPRWSADRRCVIVLNVVSFDTADAQVDEALRRYAGKAHRPDGTL